jgi:hypothetical protein
MSGNTTRSTAAGRQAAALALGLAAAGAAAAWTGPARADNSRGEGTKALVDAVPRSGTGWSNGSATLVPRGGGKYRLEYGGAPAGDGGAAQPGVPVIVDNADGNPVVERRPSAR